MVHKTYTKRMAMGIYMLNKARNTHQSIDPTMFSLVVSIDGNLSERRCVLQDGDSSYVWSVMKPKV